METPSGRRGATVCQQQPREALNEATIPRKSGTSRECQPFIPLLIIPPLPGGLELRVGVRGRGGEGPHHESVERIHRIMERIHRDGGKDPQGWWEGPTGMVERTHRDRGKDPQGSWEGRTGIADPAAGPAQTPQQFPL